MTAERIRNFRRAKDLTQKEFATLLGVKPTAVAMWEAGQAPSGPALKLLEMLIDGKAPFASSSKTPANWDVEFTLEEFEELMRRALRAGFESVRDYVSHLAKKDLNK